MLWGACLRVPRLGLGKAACVGPRPATIIILCYSQEASWREDHRRISNGDFNMSFGLSGAIARLAKSSR